MKEHGKERIEAIGTVDGIIAIIGPMGVQVKGEQEPESLSA